MGGACTAKLYFQISFCFSYSRSETYIFKLIRESENRKMGVKTEKCKGDVKERSREEGKDSYKENVLGRKGGCQAVALATAAELTEWDQ